MQDVHLKLSAGLQWQNSTIKEKALFKSDSYLRKKFLKCYIWKRAYYGAETWALQNVEQRYLENFELWCWRRIEKTSRTDM
jgi:hypothetical protein